jgi:hypothetical protein
VKCLCFYCSIVLIYFYWDVRIQIRIDTDSMGLEIICIQMTFLKRVMLVYILTQKVFKYIYIYIYIYIMIIPKRYTGIS